MSGSSVPRPLWTDSLGVGWAKWKEANLWRQMSPSVNPSVCQIFWGNSLTSLSLSFLICQTGIMRIHPSPVAECLVQGQGSVNATCHLIPLSPSSSPSSFWWSQLSPPKDSESPRPGHSLDTDSHPCFFPLSVYPSIHSNEARDLDFKFCLKPTGSNAKGPSPQIITGMRYF